MIKSVGTNAFPRAGITKSAALHVKLPILIAYLERSYPAAFCDALKGVVALFEIFLTLSTKVRLIVIVT
jgi:hypothetical protein